MYYNYYYKIKVRYMAIYVFIIKINNDSLERKCNSVHGAETYISCNPITYNQSIIILFAHFFVSSLLITITYHTTMLKN